MIRSFFVLAFLGLLTFSGWVFYARPMSSLRQQMSKKQVGRRILLLENFVVSQHENAGRLIGHTNGDRGEFYAPNRIEIRGHLYAWRLQEGQEESLQAD